MATQPTQDAVPSESPRDLKFNAGKIDEFVTSMGWTYTDRLGQKHYTIEGINYLSQQAMAAYGYVILTGKTFTTGATLNNPNEVLLNTADGEYYKWTGSFASGGKVVPANSTPSGTGGIGPGAWIGVGDASLRAALAAPGGVNLVNGAAKQSDLLALTGRVTAVENIVYYRGKTAATLGKLLQAGTALKIKGFGDSTMKGARSGDVNNVSPNEPMKMLKEALLLITGVNCTVTNYGINSTTLYDMMRGTDNPDGKTYEQRLTESACDIVYCNHGINDNQTGKDILTYRLDLIDFVNISRKNNAVPVLVTPNPNVPILTGTPANNRRLKLFVDVMRQVARDMCVDLVDQHELFNQSTNVISPSVSFPDGVHPSDAAYRQAGYNLAMPLTTYHEISNAGDNAGLDGSQFFTNSTNYTITEHGSRCGPTMTMTKESSVTGLNYPVKFAKGQKAIQLNQLQWTGACIASVTDNADSMGIIYPQKQYGGPDFNWDSTTKFYRPMYAGLHVIGINLQQSASIGNDMTFSGVILPTLNISSTTTRNNKNYSSEMIGLGDAICFNAAMSDGTEIILSDFNGVKAASVKLTSGTLRLGLFLNGSETQGINLGTGVTAGTFAIQFIVNSTGIQCDVGILTATLTTVTNLPNLKLFNSGIPFVISKA